MTGKKIVFRIHALKRMFERRIDVADVTGILVSGILVEDYPLDQPYPSKLMLGRVGNRPIHIVVAENERESEIVIVTVYEPDPERWDQEFKSRKK